MLSVWLGLEQASHGHVRVQPWPGRVVRQPTLCVALPRVACPSPAPAHRTRCYIPSVLEGVKAREGHRASSGDHDAAHVIRERAPRAEEQAEQSVPGAAAGMEHYSACERVMRGARSVGGACAAASHRGSTLRVASNLVFVRRSRFPRIESNRIDSYTGACHGCSPPEKSPRPERTDASRS